MRILAVHSSPRPDAYSHTAALLRAVRERIAELRPGWELEQIALREQRFAAADGGNRQLRLDGPVCDDDAERILERMLRADGVILASPNYCGNVNSLMMRFVERSMRLSHRRLLRGKGALALSTSASPVEADQAARYLRYVLGSYGASVVEACNIGEPIFVRDYGDTVHGRTVRRCVDAFLAAVEDPGSHVPQGRFGLDVREQIRAHPELAGRIFRSDARYFERLEAGEGEGHEPAHEA